MTSLFRLTITPPAPASRCFSASANAVVVVSGLAGGIVEAG